MSCIRNEQSFLPVSLTEGKILQINWLLKNFLVGIFIAITGVLSSFSQTATTLKYMENAAALQALQLHFMQINASGFPRIVSYVNVSDDAGYMVGGLTKDNFIVHEDGVFELPIEVVEISDDVQGVSVALALDRSGSMRESNSFDDVKAAASYFVELLHSQDQAAVISFNKYVTVDHPFSNNKNSLIAAISRLVTGSGTHIYDAVMEAANQIENQPGRRAIILLTDGEDRNSQTPFQTALNRVIEINVPVFTIGLGLNPGSPEESVLKTLASSSGGLYFASPTSEDLLKIYVAIATLLHPQYQITYTTHNPTTDGTLRHVRIDVQHLGFADQDTANYRAPNHIVTITPTNTTMLTPGSEFGLDIEIPPTSKYLYHRMKNLNLTLKYDPAYLKVKQPFSQTVIAGSLFGTATEHIMNYNVDETNGLITLTLSKNTGSNLIEGRGQLVHIDFVTGINLPDSSSLKFEIVDHLATDENNWPIATQARDLTLFSYGLIVWPGDTNKNGTVELTDVTVLGVYWDIYGPGRPTEPDLLAWKPQRAGRYPMKAAAHADADGSGIVNERDLVPIGLNWGKTKYSTSNVAKISPALPAITPQGNLRMELSRTDEPGKFLLHLIYDESPAAQMSGTTFRLNYPAGNMVITEARAGHVWPSKPLFISSMDKNHGKVAVGIMLPAGSPVLEHGGELAELIIQSENIPDLAQFKFENVGLVSPDGVIHEKSIDGFSTEETIIVPKQFSLFPAYPNPFNPTTNFRYALPEAGKVEVRIYNILGRLVFTSTELQGHPGEFSWKWDGHNQNGQIVSSGLYLVRFDIETLNGQTWTGQQKITFMK